MSLILILVLAPVFLAGTLIALRRAGARSRLVVLGAVVLFAVLVALVASRSGSGGEGAESGAATMASESSQAAEQGSEPPPVVTRSPSSS